MNLIIDGETTKVPNHMPYTPGSYMVQFGSMSGSGDHTSWLYNHPESTQSFRQNNMELQEQINEADRIIAHNMKFEMMWMTKLGIDFSHPKVFCTQVAEYLLAGQFKGPKGYYKLNQTCERRGIPGKTDKVKEFWDSGYETDEIPANILVPYNQQDNVSCGGVFRSQVRELHQNPHLMNIMRVQMGMLRLLTEIEWNGMLINRELIEQLNKEYTEKVIDYNKELEDIAGVCINWGSPAQKSALLFGGSFKDPDNKDIERYLFHYKKHPDMGVWKERNIDRIITLNGLGFRPGRGTEGAATGVYSTDSAAIAGLKARTKDQRRFLKVLSERSKAEKLRSTYFEGLQKTIIGGYVHPNMNQTIARNGRLTSSKPNGQNMPRGSTGPVKQVFISRFD